jgi:LmbE family N-acetylglucosaminyl deacetylase
MCFHVKPQTILAVSAHTDDLELGAGGSIARLVEEGHRVHIVVLSDCADSVPAGMPADTLRAECHAATRSLGLAWPLIASYPVRRLAEFRQQILEDLIRFRDTYRPDRVICHALSDRHQDHGAVAQECLRAFGCSIWGYNLLWNTKEPRSDIFVRLDERHVEAKIRALSHYKTQQQLGRPYMCPDATRSIMRSWGIQCGTQYAEAFECVRLVI